MPGIFPPDQNTITIDLRPVTPPTAGIVKRIPLLLLTPSPTNPRRIDPTDPSLLELAESLKTLGQIEPIVARELGDGFEILAGERRWRAAQIGGLADIETKVVTCDDHTALEITVVENLQRKDLHPLEEARGVRSLLDGGWAHDEIAAHLGKSVRWVVSRAQLTALTEKWLAILANKDESADLTVGHLERISRLPPETQDRVADDISNNYFHGQTLERFDEWLRERYLRQLNQAPWDLNDAALVPAAGACAGCAKRSSCQQVLFADLPAKDQCLDAACWNTKVRANTIVLAKQQAEDHERVVVIGDRNDHKGLTKSLKGVKDAVVIEGSYSLTKVKKNAPGAIAVINAEIGRIEYVKPAEYTSAETRIALGLPARPPATGRRTAGDGNGPDNAEVASNRRQAKRIAFRLKAVEGSLVKANQPALPILLRLVIALYIDQSSPRDPDAWKFINDPDPKHDQANDEANIWAHVLAHIEATCIDRVLSTELPNLTAIAAIEQLIGLDPIQQLARSHDEIPEPKKPKPAKPEKKTKAKTKTKAGKKAGKS